MTNASSEILFLNRAMIEALRVSPQEILEAVACGVQEQGKGRAVVEPTVFIRPLQSESGVATIRGALPKQNVVGIKSVGSYPGNHERGLPSDLGLMALFEADSGRPLAILDGSPITTIRTAAMTALGAKTLALPDARVVGHIGSRGISPWNIRFLDSLFDLAEIRVHSANEASYEAAAQQLDEVCRAKVVPAPSWKTCLEDAQIMIDGSSLSDHQVLFPAEVIAPGTTIIAYGAYSSLAVGALDRIDKVVMDRWQDHVTGGIGVLAPHMEAGVFSRAGLQGLLCEVLAGAIAGRVDTEETILFWHRGLGPCDIALANLYLAKAKASGAGILLPYL